MSMSSSHPPRSPDVDAGSCGQSPDQADGVGSLEVPLLHPSSAVPAGGPPAGTVATAARWAYLAESVNYALRPLVTILVARLLVPEDYGVVALALAIVGAANLLWGGGMTMALIRRQDRVEMAANVTFWTNGVLAAITTVLLVALRHPLGALFSEPRVAEILPVLSLTVLFRGFSMAHSAMLKRQLLFSRLFWRSTLPGMIPLLVTLPLAMAGYGYWALVWGAVAGSAIANLSLLLLSGWKPTLQYDWSLSREMFRFGLPTMGVAFQRLLETQMDRVLIGIFLGVREVGIYSLAVTIHKLFFEFVFTPVTNVGYAALCREVKDPARQATMFLQGQRMAALCALPLGVGLASVSMLLESVVFAGRYDGLGMVLSLLSLYYVAVYSQILFAPGFASAGRPQLMFRINLAASLLVVILYPLGVMAGLEVFILARAVIPLVLGVVAARWLGRLLGLSPSSIVATFRAPLVATLVMAAGVGGLGWTFHAAGRGSTWPSLVALVAVGALLYGGVILVMDPEVVKMVRRFATQALGRGRRGAPDKGETGRSHG